MASVFVPLILSFALSIVYIISSWYSKHAERYHQHFLSLSSGMFMGIIFLEVFPEINDGAKIFGEAIYAVALAGFVIYHLMEKYVYQHTGDIKKRIKELGYFHVLGFLFNNIIDGFILALLMIAAATFLNVFIVLIPFFLNNVAESMALRHLNDKFRFGFVGQFILSFSLFLGTVLAVLLSFSRINFQLLIALFTGFLLYFVTRDAIPRGRYGKPALFLFGALIVFIFLGIF